MTTSSSAAASKTVPPSSPITAAGLDSLYSYDVEATDPDGDALLYLLTTSPAGRTIDPVSGLMNWIPGALGDFPKVRVRVL